MDMGSLHEFFIFFFALGLRTGVLLQLACRLPPPLVLTALLFWGVVDMGSLACACEGGSLSAAATSTGLLSQPGRGESRPWFRAANA